MQRPAPPAHAPANARRRRVTPEAREAFRNELIDIARSIFLTEGYASVTIRRITAAAGVTPMAFYWYFENKDALLTHIWNDIIAESAQVCQQATAQVEAPVDRVMTYVQTFLDHWLAHRDNFRLIFLNDSHQVDFVRLRSHLFSMDGVNRHFDHFRAWVMPLFADHPDREVVVDQVRVLAMYLAFGFLHFAIGVYGYDDAAAVAHRDLVLAEFRQSLCQRQTAAT